MNTNSTAKDDVGGILLCEIVEIIYSARSFLADTNMPDEWRCCKK
jgi:hypothetical protein